MQTDWKTLFLVASLLLSLLLGFGCEKEVGAGPIAPDFRLSDLSGRTASLEEYRGNVVLLDFWATWCPPCRMSVPELVRLQEKYRDKGLVVLGISLDDPGRVSDTDLEAFRSKYKISYRILRYNEKVMQAYFPNQNPPIPTMFLIGRDGRVNAKFVGFNPGALEQALEKVMP